MNENFNILTGKESHPIIIELDVKDVIQSIKDINRQDEILLAYDLLWDDLKHE